MTARTKGENQSVALAQKSQNRKMDLMNEPTVLEDAGAEVENEAERVGEGNVVYEVGVDPQVKKVP